MPSMQTFQGYKYCLGIAFIRARLPVLALVVRVQNMAPSFAYFVFLAIFVLFVASFEADASEGLAYMHSVGIVHCDLKLANTLVCRSDDPAGFIGKVADPGCWCGESGFGSEHKN